MTATQVMASGYSGTGSGVSVDDMPSSNDSISSPPVAAILITLYAIVFVLGVFGNSLVVYVVARNRPMHTATNLFIGNLAAADVMMCLLAVPFTPLSGLLRSWPFGEVLCHIVPMTLGVSVYVSTLTSTAIAVNRYFVIIKPFQQRPSTAVCMLLVAAIWIVSITVSLPLAIYQKVSLALRSRERAKTAAVRPASSIQPHHLSQDADAASNRQQQHLPTAADEDVAVPAGSTVSAAGIVLANARRRIERKRRTNRMLIAMVSIFVCCWLPLNVIHVAHETADNDVLQTRRTDYDYAIGNDIAASGAAQQRESSTTDWNENTGNQQLQQQQQQREPDLVAFFIAHLVAMSSAVYNPFLYAWMNENFKGHFARVVPCLFQTAPTTVAGRCWCWCCGVELRAGRPSRGIPGPPAAGDQRRHRDVGCCSCGCCGRCAAAPDCEVTDVAGSVGWSLSKFTTVRCENSVLGGGGVEAMELTSAPLAAKRQKCKGGSTAAAAVNNRRHFSDDEDDDDDDVLRSACAARCSISTAVIRKGEVDNV